MGRNAGCPTGTDVGTARGTDALRCWVQNQNQNQTVLKSSCGVCGDSKSKGTSTYRPTRRRRKPLVRVTFLDLEPIA